MLLKQQYEQPTTTYESEAFNATIVVYKIRLNELQMAAGVNKHTIERFKLGMDDISTGDLGKIVSAFTPQERAFYNSMIQVQSSAGAASVKLPPLDFVRSAKSSDVYRDAMELTLSVFCLPQKSVYSRAGIQGSNFSAWLKGSRDISLANLQKIKGALSREQRAFYDAVADILVAIEPLPYTIDRANSSKQLSIA